MTILAWPKLACRFRLHRRTPKTSCLPKKSSVAEKRRLEHLVAFEDLDAQPDQLFAYHFWAEDLGPDGQPRRTESDMFFAEVRPFEEIYRQGEPPSGGEPKEPSEQGQKAEELAELQKEIINATWRVVRNSRGEISDDFVTEHDCC